MSGHGRYESSHGDEVFFATSFSGHTSRGNGEDASAVRQRRRVWLSSEYGTGVPIWDDDGLCDADGLISKTLEQEIVAWSETFDELYDPESGWPNIAMLRAHYATALRLHQRLAAELADGWEVGFRFWERNVRGVEVPPASIAAESS
ncbi:hypothetical protein K8P10_002913 [Leucobacter sp. Psy1]|uniref:hypothetical protein n=1 Tax=Leucobacter sp. Psy1 TaxID=2875729 RepID=UPI001CD34885|nr:hypothetical protein [Leucobacter sp. Psy1]UBH07402.1 hypothetical protein K8P10_002913 [Leucobacter sp. Psy1]